MGNQSSPFIRSLRYLRNEYKDVGYITSGRYDGIFAVISKDDRVIGIHDLFDPDRSLNHMSITVLEMGTPTAVNLGDEIRLFEYFSIDRLIDVLLYNKSNEIFVRIRETRFTGYISDMLFEDGITDPCVVRRGSTTNVDEICLAAPNLKLSKKQAREIRSFDLDLRSEKMNPTKIIKRYQKILPFLVSLKIDLERYDRLDELFQEAVRQNCADDVTTYLLTAAGGSRKLVAWRIRHHSKQLSDLLDHALDLMEQN